MRRRRDPARSRPQRRTPGVTFQPQSAEGMQRGINLLADVVRPTLGPVPRIVAVEPIDPGNKRPELLDSGGVVARRVLQLPNRDTDVGAMFLRHLLWRQHERVGDGTATTAVIFQSIYNQGITYIRAGGNAMRLRAHLERGMRVVLEEHQALATPLRGKGQIAGIANVLSHDDELAQALAEVFDTVSEHGTIEVRSGRTLGLERQYVIGSYFKGKPLSEWFLSPLPNRRAELRSAAVLVSDLAISDPAELTPLWRAAEAADASALLLVARELSEGAVAAVLAAGRAARPCQVVAVRAPDATTGQAAMLDDLAALTGARRLHSAAGDTLRRLEPEHLGRARRAWADDEFFGIVSGKGDPRALRAHLATLRAAWAHAEDPATRKKLRERIGKLLGGTAVLWVGGVGDSAIAARKELAERTIDAVRATIGGGVVPGGGVSLLACRPALRRLAAQADDADEAFAYRVLARALEEPTRTLMHNAGYEAGAWMGRIDRAGPGHGLDVTTGEIVDVAAAGIIDSAGVLQAALHGAIAGAALALTVDVLVHKGQPEVSLEP
jgi:chaperonin GroEL